MIAPGSARPAAWVRYRGPPRLSRGGPNARGAWGAISWPPMRLDVVVERELPRVRPQAHGVDLVLPLVVDPRLDDVGREHVALEQPVVALLEVVEHDVERTRQLLDLLLLGRLQLVEVLVHRLAGIDLVGDAVEAGHHAGRERQVRIAGRIGRTELDALGALRLRVHRDPDRRRTVALAVHEVDRRLVAGHQPL